MTEPNYIELEGVRVHNLKNISLRIRHRSLTVICGVSGSGKSSLAFDTLYAEGQRRYIETFSPYARQFLDRIERPDADRIDGIPPAIAIRQGRRSQSSRSTVGTRTEILDYLRLVFVRAGQFVCPDCLVPVTSFDPPGVSRWLLQNAVSAKAIIAFSVESRRGKSTDMQAELQSLQRRGFTRVVYENRLHRIENLQNLVADGELAIGAERLTTELDNKLSDTKGYRLLVVVDRIQIEPGSIGRIEESLETAFAAGDGSGLVLLPSESAEKASVVSSMATDNSQESNAAASEMKVNEDLVFIDGSLWRVHLFCRELSCLKCHRTFSPPVPESLNFNSPIGACLECEGFGSLSTMTLEKVVPDPSLSIREGAIAPWNTPAYLHEREELLALAKACGVPVDVPFSDLNEAQRAIIVDGVPEKQFGGLKGFHRWLVRHRYKMGVRVFLNRWRSWVPCAACNGRRLNSDAALIRLSNSRFDELLDLELHQVESWLCTALADLTEERRIALHSVIDHLRSRIRFLVDCGLGYLSLNRSMKTVSGGEAQRVMLTAALGSGLINTLYVLDEPTTGLHGTDTQKVIQAARRLQSAGNTVVVVEHDPNFILSADEVFEIGPAAGGSGGQVVFRGTPEQLLNAANSPTGSQLAAFSPHSTLRRNMNATIDARTAGKAVPSVDGVNALSQRQPEKWLTVTNVKCHNIHGIDVRIPLGLITALMGVSGSGKSSLLVQSIYPAVCRGLGIPCDIDGEGTVETVVGIEDLQNIVLLDQQPLQRSSRSIPATWIGVFDDIRKLLAETHEAKKRNYSAGMFSFNSSRGGRCSVCEGMGVVTVEMQFLADIETTCEECHGRRFRADVLEVRYRDRSVHDILDMTSDEAFTFFNGHNRIQQRLNAIRQAGLGYLRLGQPLSTLSGGEAQRLRIAALLAGVPLGEGETAATNRKSARVSSAGRTLFILDEPSTGLHLQDIDRLLVCLNFLVQTGHTVVVIEHDEYLLQKTDYMIQMGPGAGRQGGKIVATSLIRPTTFRSP